MNHMISFSADTHVCIGSLVGTAPERKRHAFVKLFFHKSGSIRQRTTKFVVPRIATSGICGANDAHLQKPVLLNLSILGNLQIILLY